jgi:hypothetical protein
MIFRRPACFGGQVGVIATPFEAMVVFKQR